MNLENLISKYLDGELDEREDAVLRQAIAEDAESKEIFDAAVEIKIAAAEDASSIKPPKDLVEETENAVLMKMFAAGKIVEERSKPKVLPLWRYAAAAAAVLAIAAIAINDGSFRLPKAFPGVTNEPMIIELPILSAPNTAAESVDEGEDISYLAETIAYDNSIDAGEISDAVDAADIAIPEGYSTFTDNTGGAFASNNFNLTDETSQETAEFVASENVSRVSALRTDLGPNDGLSLTAPFEAGFFGSGEMSEGFFNYFDISSNRPSNVYVASFLSTDLLRTGAKTDPAGGYATHFSQSLGYDLTENDKMGLEVGYTHYDYFANESVRVPLGKTRPLRPNVIDPTDDLEYIEIPIEVSEHKSIFWGSVFYERSFDLCERVSASGRLGAGLTGDGGVGFLRTYASLRTFDWLYFNFGAEGRMYSVSMPRISQDPITMKSLSISYGFRLKF